MLRGHRPTCSETTGCNEEQFEIIVAIIRQMAEWSCACLPEPWIMHYVIQSVANEVPVFPALF